MQPSGADPPVRGRPPGRLQEFLNSPSPLRFACALIALLISPFLLSAAEQHGQVKFGELGVPGATVTATQGDKTLSVITDQQGVYIFPDLPDGNWTFQVEMLCFTPIKQDVAITAGLPAPDWELKLLPLAEIQAAAGPAAPKPAAIQITKQTPAAAPNATQAKNNAKPKKNAPTPPPQTAFQKTDVNASAPPASAPPAAPAASEAFASQNAADLSQRASDGFLINGSQNNGASSPFSQNPAFGNNRRGLRSLYNFNLSLTGNNSVLDAQNFSLTGQQTPKSAQNLLTGAFSAAGPLRIPHLLRNGPLFFANYQWTRNRTAQTNTTLALTQAGTKRRFFPGPERPRAARADLRSNQRNPF